MWKYIQKIQHLPPTHENSFTRAVTVFMSSRWLWEILPGQKESHGSHKVFPWWTKIYLWAVPEAVFCKGMLHVFIMCTLSRELRFRKIWSEKWWNFQNPFSEILEVFMATLCCEGWSELFDQGSLGWLCDLLNSDLWSPLDWRWTIGSDFLFNVLTKILS